jgi:hypothetical protein
LRELANSAAIIFRHTLSLFHHEIRPPLIDFVKAAEKNSLDQQQGKSTQSLKGGKRETDSRMWGESESLSVDFFFPTLKIRRKS